MLCLHGAKAHFNENICIISTHIKQLDHGTPENHEFKYLCASLGDSVGKITQKIHLCMNRSKIMLHFPFSAPSCSQEITISTDSTVWSYKESMVVYVM